MRKWVDLDGQLVLQLLTDHAGMTWDELSQAAGLSRIPGGGQMQLFNCLESLAEQDLISVDGVLDSDIDALFARFWTDKQRKPSLRTAKLRASQRWSKIQMALNAKWLGVPRPNAGFSMLVEPHFGPPMALPTKADIFVLMPFQESFLPIYRDHIRVVAEKLNLSCARADDLFTSHDLMIDVWSSICGAGVIIADCTGRNPNVFYEMGLAHSVGKPVILITQSANDIPADIKRIRYIAYTYTPRGMKEFEENLAKTISTTMELYIGPFHDAEVIER
jgi:hypothetical protein